MVPTVVWAAEIIRDELVYIAEEISKESFEGVALFLLVAYSKMGDERDKLLEELLNTKEIRLDDLGDQ